MPRREKVARRPKQELRFFMDRSLGRKKLPRALRAEEWDIETMAEVYTEHVGQKLPDPPWIDEQSARGLALLTKDQGFRNRRGPVREAVIRAKARVFLLATAGYGHPEQHEAFRVNRNRIFMRAEKPGPYVYVVYKDRLEPYWTGE